MIAIAAAANTDKANVKILSIKETSRRAAKSVEVEVQIAVKDKAGAERLAGAINIAAVNRELQKQGLKTATFTKEPAAGKTGGGGLSSGAIAGIVVGTLAGVGVLVSGVNQYH